MTDATLFARVNRLLGQGTLLEFLLAAVKTMSIIILIVMGASLLLFEIRVFLASPPEFIQ